MERSERNHKKTELSLFLYSASVCILMFGADPGIQSGEGPFLVSASQSLGIGHPPGYPFYMMISRAFALLPFGTIAFRHTILAILIACSACLIVWRLSGIIFQSSGLAGFLFLMTLPAFLGNCLKAEVYAVNLLLFGLFLLLWRTYEDRRDSRWLIALFFVSGLWCGHHLTLVLLLPFLFVLLFSCHRELFNRQFLTLAFTFMALGISVLIYTPIRSAGYPLINWGVPTNVKRFLTLVTAGEEAMPSMLSSFSVAGIQHNLTSFAALLGSNVTLWMMTVMSVGVVTLFVRSRSFFFVTLGSSAILAAAIVVYSTNEQDAFFIIGFYICAIWFEGGIAYLGRITRSFTLSPYLVHTVTIALVILLLVPRVNPLKEWFESDEIPFDLELFTRGISNESRGASLVMTERSNLYFIMMYGQVMENEFQETTPVFRHCLSFPWYLLYELPLSLPLTPDFDIETVVSDTQVWNETIASALLWQEFTRRKVFVLEPDFTLRVAKTFFPDISLIPRGFSFQLGEGNCSAISFSPEYQRFSDMTIRHHSHGLNGQMFAYLHERQRELLNLMGCFPAAQRELEWKEALMRLQKHGPSL